MPTFNRIRGEESSTTTFKAATLTQTRNSSVMHQEIVSIGDTDSSLGIAAVLATTPASTSWGLVIRLPDSTLTAVSSLGGVVTVTPNAGSTFATRPLQSSAADLQMTATPAAGSTWAVRPLQSSAADLQVTATPAAGSTFNVRPLQSSAADLQMTVGAFASGLLSTSAPAGNSSGLNIWQVNYSTIAAISSVGGVVTVTPNAGSTWAVRPLQSSAADLQVTATPAAGSTFNVRPLQSSAADLQVTATPAAGSTWAVRPLQSSQADLRVTAYQSTAAEFVATVRLQDGSGNALESSTQTNSSGGRGLFVRPLIPGSTTYAGSTAGESTMTALFSSAATNRLYVYAYSFTSTGAGPITCSFCNSSGGSTLWVIRLAAISSAISGANMAVTPPGYLFRNSTGANLTLNMTSSLVAGMAVSVAAFRSS